MKNYIIRTVKMMAYYSFLGLVLQGILVNLLFAVTPSEGQNLRDIKVSVKAVDVTLEQALQMIEQKTNFKFSFSKDEIPLNEKATVIVEDESLYNILEVFAKDYGLIFNRINDQIVIKKSQGQKENLVTTAETFTVEGKVTDAEKGEPLIGASVVLKPLNLGALTDLNGHYSFDVPSSQASGQSGELTASYINYKKKSVKVILNGSNITQNFTLEEDIFQSEEIVVTGIASKTSKSVAEVAVARIPVTDLTDKQAYQSFSQLVTGKLAGVKVQTTSGNIGAGWRFYIRGGGGLNGNEQPLYFLDGVQLTNLDYLGTSVGGASISILSNLNPNDIENIEVLKGPAASAMYGTNASNGVVLITTKSGKSSVSGAKGINATYSYDYGMNTQAFKYNSDWLNADHVNALLSHSGLIREHTLTLSGGSGLFRYYTSFQNHFEAGLIPDQNNMDRSTLRANITAVPADNLNVQVSTQYVDNKINRPSNDNYTTGWMLNAWSYYPAYSTTDSVAISMIQDYSLFKQFTGSVKATWQPINNLEINGTYGIDYINTWQDQYYTWGFKYPYPATTTGARTINTTNRVRSTYDWSAKYNLDLFSKLNLTTIVGAQLIGQEAVSLSAGGKFFLHPNITTIQSGDSKSAVLGSNTYAYSKSAGIYWENDFSYDNTYFWTLAVRKDYANTIGSDAPSIIYPKASMAIRLDKFDFLPSAIPLLKLRVAYGESGQLPGLLDALPLALTTSSGGQGQGIVPNSLGNSGIEPERIKELEVGFDMEFLKIFSLEFTYWNQNAQKSIVRAAIAPSFGFNTLTYPYNLGEVTGHGIESLLQIHPFSSSDYNLSLNLILNYQTNNIVSLGGTTSQISYLQTYEKPGYRKHEFFGVKTTTPIFDATGKLINYDNNGGIVVDCGNPIPDWTGSISVNFRFLKNFTFYAFGDWGLNNYVYSYSIGRGIRAGGYAPANRLGTQLGIIGNSTFGSLVKDPTVTPLTPGTPEYIDAANQFAQYMQRDAGNFMYPADFFILRELSLSYDCTDLIRDVLSNKYITSLTVGASVRNVFKISKFDYDNDTNYGGGNNATFASDMGTLPQARTFNFWLKFGF